MRFAPVQLSHVAAVVLSLATSGCCVGVEDDVWTSQLDEVFVDEALAEIRDGASTDVARCEAACQAIATLNGEYDRLISCEASGGDAELPTWDPGQTEVTVVCEAEFRSPGFCTGRRPLGHHESSIQGSSCHRGNHFAELAYLEAASIRAFVELADWLEQRGAPGELIVRCRAAAADEVVHAELMAEQARREGVEVEEAHADPGSDDLLAVALHNAVEGCVNEAFAAVLVAHQARVCDSLGLRDIFARIAVDELRHGQLAWDLHAWLMDRLDAADRARVEAAQQAALARLASSTRINAMQVPDGLGWPSPDVAAGLAERFAALVQQPVAIAA